MNDRLPIYTPTQAVLEASKCHTQDGFLGKVAIVNLGCPKNVVDSEVALGLYTKKGFQVVGDCSIADIVVVNTCAFIESAVEESIDRILEIGEYKTKGQCKLLIVTGCLVDRYGEELVKELPEVDRFVPWRFLEHIAGEEDLSHVIEGNENYIYNESNPRVISTPGHYSYLKIADGCNRPCAFCIIPKLRGKYRSRRIESVVNEVTTLSALGVKEFNLVAQDTTNFGADRSGGKFIELLKAIDKELESRELLSWVRVLYSYPKGVNKELLQFIRQSPYLCNYIDLPLQHVSQSVLKKMHRPLGDFSTRNLVEKMHKWNPDLKLRTTFLVGFPGETEEDITELENFVKEGHFTQVGVFPFFPEEECAAANLSSNISKEEKEERCARVIAAQLSVLTETLKGYQGTKTRVLVDGFHEDTDLLLSGRTEWQAPEVDNVVIINDIEEELRDSNDTDFLNESLIGRFVEVEITGVAAGDLVGKVLSLSTLG